MEKQIEELINTIKECSKSILEELGPGWKEDIYQNAMEVALRDKGIMYENQRPLPITYSGHVIGDVIPDLVVWLKENGHKIALVVELKSEPGIKEEFQVQVERYIKELRKQVKQDETVWAKGILINFIKEANNTKIQEGFEDLSGIQCLESPHKYNISISPISCTFLTFFSQNFNSSFLYSSYTIIMSTLIILIIFGLGMAYFATQNTGLIHLTVANFYSGGIPLYIVVIGSMLLGIFISWLISLVNSLTASFKMRKINSQMRNANRTIDELTKKNAALLKENDSLKKEQATEEIKEPVTEEQITRPRIFQQPKHSLA